MKKKSQKKIKTAAVAGLAALQTLLVFAFFAPGRAEAAQVLSSISVTPSWTSITEGSNQQFSATALDQLGSPMVPQPTFTWSTFNPTLGSIDNTGLFTPLAAGQMTIYAKAGGKTGTAHISVSIATTPVIKSVNVSPVNPSVGLGGTLQLTATAFDQNYNPLATQPSFSWTLGNTTIGSVDGNGLFTALSPGAVIVTATAGGIVAYKGTATVTVQNAPPVLAEINVTPANNPAINAGATRQFSAEALDQYGAPMNVAVTWSSSNISVGTVDSTSGLVTAVSPGTAAATATSGSISGSAPFTVQNAPPVLTTIKVTPGSSTVNVGATQQYSAQTLDQYGAHISSAVNWSSSDQSIGKIDGNGFFNASRAGNATITASSGSVIGIAQQTVNAVNAPMASSSPALSIENVSVTDITNNSAKVRWSTPGNSSGEVVFGTKTKKNKKTKQVYIVRGKTVSDSNSGTDHSVDLTGLKKKKKYYILVNASDSSGSTSSSIQSFKTSKNVPTIAVGSADLPNVSVTNITASSATISWTTGAESTGTVYFSTKKKKLSAHISDDNSGKDHSVSLSGLSRNKKYYFNVVIQKSDGSKSLTSVTLSFKTLKN